MKRFLYVALMRGVSVIALGGQALAEDHETATIAIRNGDNLKGVVTLAPVSLETLFGTVKVGVAHVTRINVLDDVNGLVAYWKFNKNANDSSGAGNHGTWSGSADYEHGLGHWTRVNKSVL